MKKLYTGILATMLSASLYGAVFIIGDSTASHYEADRYPRMGWGQALDKYLDTKVINEAVSGRSSKSFFDEGYWSKVDSELKSGDYVFIQFGHNDQKKEDTARYTEPGTTYNEQLKFYVEETRKKGATPVLMTSIHRRRYRDGKIVDSHKEYLTATEQVAKELKVPFIDIAKKTEILLNRVGEEESKSYFLVFDETAYPVNYPKGANDNTHLSEKGANAVAQLVVEGIKENNLPLKNRIK